MIVSTSETCVRGFCPGVINAKWGHRPGRVSAGTEASGLPGLTSSLLQPEKNLVSGEAAAAHPDDVLDQYLHDQHMCGCSRTPRS